MWTAIATSAHRELDESRARFHRPTYRGLHCRLFPSKSINIVCLFQSRNVDILRIKMSELFILVIFRKNVILKVNNVEEFVSKKIYFCVFRKSKSSLARTLRCLHPCRNIVTTSRRLMREVICTVVQLTYRQPWARPTRSSCTRGSSRKATLNTSPCTRRSCSARSSRS